MNRQRLCAYGLFVTIIMFNGTKVNMKSKSLSRLGRWIRVGFSCVVWCSWRYTVKFSDFSNTLTVNFVVLANYEIQKEALWWGGGKSTLLQPHKLIKNTRGRTFFKKRNGRVRRSLAFLCHYFSKLRGFLSSIISTITGNIEPKRGCKNCGCWEAYHLKITFAILDGINPPL